MRWMCAVCGEVLPFALGPGPGWRDQLGDVEAEAGIGPGHGGCGTGSESAEA